MCPTHRGADVETLADLLATAKRSSVPITCTLLTGQQLVMTVSSVGRAWFSGETLASEPVGVVIPMGSLRSVAGKNLTFRETDSIVSEVPIARMLVSLMRLKKRVVVYSSSSRRQGFICRVGSDFIVISHFGAPEVITPLSSISWIAVP